MKPETSKGWVFGVVVSPSMLPGFSLEANHYNIRIKGPIQPVDASITSSIKFAEGNSNFGTFAN